MPAFNNEKTPPAIKHWLDFIADSLDGEMNAANYPNNLWQKILTTIEKQSIGPALLSEIKDDMAWEEAKKTFVSVGVEIGLEKGRQELLKQQKQIIDNARKIGLDDLTISQLTGLSIAQIRELD
ncbi:MAG: hypothetical protein RL637_1039 [Pseudomonadota bacterium]|jgi:hypothetical protein